jgi:hypothetical protein
MFIAATDNFRSLIEAQHHRQHLLGVVVFAILIFLVLELGRWAWRDAEARGKSGLAAAVLVVFVTFPLGLILWLALRPPLLPPPADGPAEDFDLERYRLQ